MTSTRRSILFVSLAESGVLNPLLVLAGELARRGVPGLWFATDESRRLDVERLAGASLVEFASLGEAPPGLSLSTIDDESYRGIAHPGRFRSHRSSFSVYYNPPLQTSRLRRLQTFVDHMRPDLMVIDNLSLFAVALALSRGIPFVLSNPFLPSHVLTGHIPLFTKTSLPWDFPAPHTGLPHPMRPRQQAANQFFKLRNLAMMFSSDMRERVKADMALCRELAIPFSARGSDVPTRAAELVLSYSVPEVEYPFTPPPAMRMVGTMLPPLPEAPGDTTIADWLDTRPSVVYIGLGTLTRLSRADVLALVEVARRLAGRHHVLWKLPKGEQRLLPPDRDLPPNLRIEQWLPSQHDVLAHPSVKVVLSHGGSNGFHESLYFGKPLVIRPLWLDCHDVAARGSSLGASLTVDRPYDIDPADIAGKLNRVLGDDSFRRAAESAGAALRAAGGRDTAADLILGLPALAAKDAAGDQQPTPQPSAGPTS